MEQDLARIGEQWDVLLGLCADPDRFEVKTEAVSAWDVGQHLGHVAIVMNLIAGAIENMLANPGEGAGLSPHEMGVAVLKGGEIPRGRGKAPDEIILQVEPNPSEIESMLRAAKEKWDGFPSKTQAIQDCPATFPHFALGNFTPSQWVKLTPVHTHHHLKILRDILEPAGHSLEF